MLFEGRAVSKPMGQNGFVCTCVYAMGGCYIKANLRAMNDYKSKVTTKFFMSMHLVKGVKPV